jgi:hypothetical protein
MKLFSPRDRRSRAANESICAKEPQAELGGGPLHVAVESGQRQLPPLRELNINGVIDRQAETIAKFERCIPGSRIRLSVHDNVEVTEIGQRRTAEFTVDPPAANAPVRLFAISSRHSEGTNAPCSTTTLKTRRIGSVVSSS